MCIASGSAQTITPQGRLTLATGHPVMSSDATAQTTIYYDCFAGNVVPVGATPSNLAIGSCEISMGLDAVTPHIASGSLYDVFGISNSGTLTLCAGPAWSSTTTRGTGAGTTQIDQTNGGLWTNTNSLTHCWGGASGTTDFGTVAAHAGTYLGTFYATANGQTGMQFQPSAAAGGSNNILALWNAYNRVIYQSLERDSTSSWTYNSTTWRVADNSNSNRITWVDGLGYSLAAASYMVETNPTSGANSMSGVNFDATTGAPAGVFADVGITSNTLAVTVAGGNTFVGFGLHFAQAMEARSSAVSGSWSGSANGSGMSLFVSM